MLPSIHSRSPCGLGVQDPSSVERISAEYYYRPSGQGDVFLFSPGVSSMTSNASISSSSSSSSFDTLSYSFSPADVGAAPKLFSPPSLPSATGSGSPLFVEAYLSGTESKPIARMSPSTPFDELFNSSPAGYWQAGDLSVSPISRHSSVVPAEDACEVDSDDDDDIGAGKLKSLLEYASTRDLPDTPRSQRASSPLSLSSLSSVPSSPSALFSGLPASSSQTSRGRTPSCSPAKRAPVRLPLGSPFKMHSERSAGSRLRPQRALPVPRTTRRSLAAEILNQLGGSRSQAAIAGPSSSPSKRPSSPLPTLSDSDDENYEPGTHRRTRKRSRPLNQERSTLRKKRRTTTVVPVPPASTSGPVNDPEEQDSGETPTTYPNRTFPLRIPVHEDFPLFYRRFHVSSVVDVNLAATHKISVPKVPDALSNPAREAFDLYTPRFVKGKGTTKVGLCPICHEKSARGGEGKKLWLSMKFSAFKCYHMQYAHGISPSTGRPFSPPTAFRDVTRANPGKHEKTRISEGKCHKCKKWVPVEGIKDVPSKVKEIFWWKHAATCHQGSTIVGEGDVFVEDDVFRAVVGAQQAVPDDEDQDAECDEDAEGESVHEDEELE